MPEKWKKRPSCPHLHPPIAPLLAPLSSPSPFGNSLSHYFVPRPEHPRRSNHLHNGQRSERACPVVLFLSSPVSLIIAKSSIAPSLHPWALVTEIQQESRTLKEYKLNCRLSGFNSCWCFLGRVGFNMDPQKARNMECASPYPGYDRVWTQQFTVKVKPALKAIGPSPSQSTSPGPYMS